MNFIEPMKKKHIFASRFSGRDSPPNEARPNQKSPPLPQTGRHATLGGYEIHLISVDKYALLAAPVAALFYSPVWPLTPPCFFFPAGLPF